MVADACGGNAEVWSIIGLLTMMLMIAVATGLMIFKSALKPLCLKGVRTKDITDSDGIDAEKERNLAPQKRKNPALVAISSSLWGLTVIGYIVIGLLAGLWHPGWMVFLITMAVDNIVEAIFEICGKKYL